MLFRLREPFVFCREFQAVENRHETRISLLEMPIGSLIFFLLIVALIVGSFFWQSSRSHDILSKWAADNGYRLLQAKYATFFKGPFTLTSSRGQTVYRVVVQDHAGHLRQGWVRCGSWWGGLMSEQTQVRWDDE